MRKPVCCSGIGPAPGTSPAAPASRARPPAAAGRPPREPGLRWVAAPRPPPGSRPCRLGSACLGFSRAPRCPRRCVSRTRRKCRVSSLVVIVFKLRCLDRFLLMFFFFFLPEMSNSCYYNLSLVIFDLIFKFIRTKFIEFTYYTLSVSHLTFLACIRLLGGCFVINIRIFLTFL